MTSLDDLTMRKSDISESLRELGRVSDKALNIMANSLRDDVAELCSLVAKNAGRLDAERYGDAPAYIKQVQEVSNNLTMLCDQINVDVQNINEQLELRDLAPIKMRKYDDITETITHFATDFVNNAAKDVLREIQKVKDMVKGIDPENNKDKDDGSRLPG